MSPQDVGLDGFGRLFNHQLHTHRRCQVDNRIGSACQPVEDQGVVQGVDGKVIERVMDKFANIIEGAGAEIIEN